LRGEKVAAASDIYSMAVIAYEMVTGRRPFNPASGPQLLEMHRVGVRVKPVDLRSTLSTQAQAIILRALSFEPQHRYQTASEFGDDLARALSDDEARPKPAEQNANERMLTEARKDGDLNALASTRQVSLDPSVKPVSDAGAANSTIRHAGKSKRASARVRLFAVSLILVVGIAALLGIYISRANKQASSLASGSQRSFTYWLTVQKMRDGRLYRDPFQSSGQEIFENGYKFRLNVSSTDSGYLYVINEGPTEEDGTSLTMVYPTPLRKNAFVSNQPVQTNWNTFRGQAGTEKFWIIWSASPVDQLEAAKTEAFDNRKGAVADLNSIRTVKEFLMTHAKPKPEITKDTTAQQTRVSGAGDVLVMLAELEHR